jgi:membrane associated rhomboid family serine protease
MLPIGDDNTYRLRTPLVTWLFIAANILAFIFIQGFGTDESVVYSYSMVPQEILSGQDLVTPSRVAADPLSRTRYTVPGLAATPIPVYLTLLTSLFLHGGFAHIAGNMLFLSIFGDNVEDRLGHLRFFLFYILSGLAGSAAHIAVSVFTGDGLMVPTLGASGAISGVMGAYLLLFPGNRVRVLLFSIIPTTVSAFVAIGMWFLFQLVNGLGYLGGSRGDGVAYAAHIGGFLFGLFVVKRFLPRRRRVRYHYF